ncbi:hypothetical protein C8Q80DRAFT_1275890 [Daedaleopsis nitida]|nr:hypothetical protein C8Q80DRAFT_1275890 [Daedaleopsis nitida]
MSPQQCSGLPVLPYENRFDLNNVTIGHHLAEQPQTPFMLLHQDASAGAQPTRPEAPEMRKGRTGTKRVSARVAARTVQQPHCDAGSPGSPLPSPAIRFTAWFSPSSPPSPAGSPIFGAGSALAHPVRHGVPVPPPSPPARPPSFGTSSSPAPLTQHAQKQLVIAHAAVRSCKSGNGRDGGPTPGAVAISVAISAPISRPSGLAAAANATTGAHITRHRQCTCLVHAAGRTFAVPVASPSPQSFPQVLSIPITHPSPQPLLHGISIPVRTEQTGAVAAASRRCISRCRGASAGPPGHTGTHAPVHSQSASLAAGHDDLPLHLPQPYGDLLPLLPELGMLSQVETAFGMHHTPL